MIWRELLHNLSSAPASVLAGGQAYDVIKDPNAQTVARRPFLEGAAVARARGFDDLDSDLGEIPWPGSRVQE